MGLAVAFTDKTPLKLNSLAKKASVVTFAIRNACSSGGFVLHLKTGHLYGAAYEKQRKSME
ncbi:MAG: hypothetical protein ACPG80_02590 [Rickettsiales bacterium]